MFVKKRAFNLLTNMLQLNAPELINSSNWLDQYHLLTSPKNLTHDIQGSILARAIFCACLLGPFWTSFHFFSNRLNIFRTTETLIYWKWMVFAPTKMKTLSGEAMVKYIQSIGFGIKQAVSGEIFLLAQMYRLFSPWCSASHSSWWNAIA